MENKEHVRLWDCDTDYKPLRRPNSKSQVTESKPERNVEEQKITENTQLVTSPINYNDILNKSSLRVEAKEWFPANYSQGQETPPVVQQSAQSRLKRIRSGSNSSELYSAEEASQKVPFESENLDILIQSLIYDPGQFDNLVENFIGILAPYFDDIEVAIKAATTIFDNALNEPSFRYNAARLCSILDEHYPFFRPRLHSLCHKELSSGQHRQGLTLFLAELYMQLNYETMYGKILLSSLKELISSKRPDDIKSACQALKLAGYSLDLNDHETLNEMFNELGAMKTNLHQSLRNLVESVFTLRQNNWGRSINTTTTENSAQEQNGVLTSSSDEEFVLYGPDGQEISLEEQEFLCSNLGDDGDYLGDESCDPDDLYDPEPEMDEEIQEAFREFVKMGKR